MTRHTSMPPRLQKTPHGDVALTSRWMRNHYWLVAYGPTRALAWMFPGVSKVEVVGAMARHTFEPSPTPITVLRDLLRACTQWQNSWDDRHTNATLSPSDDPAATPSTAITTIGELLSRRLLDRKSTIQDSTWEKERSHLDHWKAELGEAHALPALSVHAIQAALTRISARTSPQTANCSLATLLGCFRWAERLGIAFPADVRHVRRIREPAKARRRVWWTAQQVDQAIAIAASTDFHQPTAHLLVACGCLLGLRLEELIMQRWQDIDLTPAAPVCHVTPHDQWQPKDKEARTVPICRPLLNILQQHQRPEGYLIQAQVHRKSRRTSPEPSVWAYRYNPNALWRKLKAAFSAAGLPAITMLEMRHTFASNLLAAGVPDFKVARWMGHGDTRMVHRHYGHLQAYDDAINATSQTA